MIYGVLGYLLGVVIALAYLIYKDKLVEWLDKKIKIVKE